MCVVINGLLVTYTWLVKNEHQERRSLCWAQVRAHRSQQDHALNVVSGLLLEGNMAVGGCSLLLSQKKSSLFFNSKRRKEFNT